MLKKEFNDMLDNMDYNTQKEKLRLLQEDTQQYDDNWNCLEILVLSVINVFKTIFK